MLGPVIAVVTFNGGSFNVRFNGGYLRDNGLFCVNHNSEGIEKKREQLAERISFPENIRRTSQSQCQLKLVQELDRFPLDTRGWI